MIQFMDRIIENETLVLENRNEVYYLGHNLTLKGCTLIIKIPARALVVAKTLLVDCVIEARRELKEFRWDSAILRGCRFKGKFSGCDFGAMPSAPESAAVMDCDFTEARLHWCRLMRCDTSTMRFPSWPCVTILDPVRRLDELKRISWPGRAGLLVGTLAGTSSETASLTVHATKFAREHDTTPEAFKAALQALTGVIS